MPQMRDEDAPADHQGHIERFVKFLILPAGLHTLQDMVINAIYSRIFILTCPLFTRTIFAQNSWSRIYARCLLSTNPREFMLII